MKEAMKTVMKLTTVTRFYDEYGNILDEVHEERILEGKEAEGIKSGVKVSTCCFPVNDYVS